jgi:septal ring-binding cell division protein DamX
VTSSAPAVSERKPDRQKTQSPVVEKPVLNAGRRVTEARRTPPGQKTLVPVASARISSPAPAALKKTAPSASVKETRASKAVQIPKINITPAIRPVSSQPRLIGADQLFNRYTRAGNRWNEKKYGNKFTVQLLVLSTSNAIARVKSMIVRKEYQEHGRKFYILHRNTIPPTLFVCYGVYSSMEEARNARNTMPLFLRKHHPYALSIRDVLAKARD